MFIDNDIDTLWKEKFKHAVVVVVDFSVVDLIVVDS
jgi:hypothetical protein